MRSIITALIFVSLCAASSAQSLKDVRINEILVKNVDNFEDDYGHRESWVELHNTGFSSANVGGCYLEASNGVDTVRYRIPKGDARTVIEPQGYLVFYCEGTGSKGTFHTNFRLDDNTRIAFYDQGGREPVSEIIYDLDEQLPDVSVGYLAGKDGPVFGTLTATTPNATNEIDEKVPQHEIFRRVDPSGMGMAVTAMSVVFSALIVLYFIFRQVGRTMQRIAERKAQRAAVAESVPAVDAGEVVSGEIIAAIAMAMRQYDDDLHDIESTVLTINRVGRTYSPWNSKIYGLTRLPERKR